MQIELFNADDIAPIVLPDGIDYRCASVDAVLQDLTQTGTRAKLVYADPPWVYSQAPGFSADPACHYKQLTDADIANHLRDAHAVGATHSRLLVWCTWPKLGEFWEQFNTGKPWRYVSGGSWHKHGGRSGVGYHWLGKSEPALLYKKGSPACRWNNFTNAHNSKPGLHSVKPVDFLIGMLQRWTDPGDLVVDLYAGLGSMALACHRTGRRYIGAEIDKKRHQEGLQWLHARNCGQQRETVWEPQNTDESRASEPINSEKNTATNGLLLRA